MASWRAVSLPVLKCWWNQPVGGLKALPGCQSTRTTSSPWPRS
jgi:hypothetical protein